MRRSGGPPRMKVRRKKGPRRGCSQDAANEQTKQTEFNNQNRRQQVERFVAALFQLADWLEIRLIRKAPDSKSTQARSLFCRASELVAMIPRLLRENRDGWNVYVSANARKHRGGRKASDVDCARSLFADWDKTTLEHARANWNRA